MTALVSAVERVLDEVNGLTAVAVVGLAKNCGKTTALKHLIAGYRDTGHTIAVTSAGRDGEPVDAVTRRMKPAILVPAGTWIATAESLLAGPMENVHRTPCATGLGDVMAARTSEEARVELAGPVSAGAMVRLRDLLCARGVTRLLIDGAMDRLAVAAPGVAGAVVLSVGAVLGPTPEAVAGLAAHWAGVLRLSEPPTDVARLAGDLGEGRGGWLIDEARNTEVVSGSLLLNPVGFRERLKPRHRWLITGGAVTDDLLQGLSEAGGLTVVLRDASRALVSADGLRRWRACGGSLAVLQPVRLAALTVNPHHPTGPDLEPDRLLAAVAAAVKDRPVCDVMRGTEANR